MNGFKNKIKSNFTAIPNCVINNNKLSWKAKGIFLYLASKPNSWQFFMEEIQKNATDGKTALKSGLKELQKHGYLIREKAKDEKGQFNGWDWTLTLPDRQVSRPSDFPTDGFSDRRVSYPYSNIDSSKKDSSKNELSKKNAHSFEEFWDAYDKKIDRKKAEPKWNRLTKSEQEAVMAFIPIYKKFEPDPQYRKHPTTFLNNKTWESEFIINQVNKKNNGKGTKGTIEHAEELEHRFEEGWGA